MTFSVGDKYPLMRIFEVMYKMDLIPNYSGTWKSIPPDALDLFTYEIWWDKDVEDYDPYAI